MTMKYYKYRQTTLLLFFVLWITRRNFNLLFCHSNKPAKLILTKDQNENNRGNVKSDIKITFFKQVLEVFR